MLTVIFVMLFCAITSTRAADFTSDARPTFQCIAEFGTPERVFDDPHIFSNRVDTTTGRAAVVLTPAQQDFASLSYKYVERPFLYLKEIFK